MFKHSFVGVSSIVGVHGMKQNLAIKATCLQGAKDQQRNNIEFINFGTEVFKYPFMVRDIWSRVYFYFFDKFYVETKQWHSNQYIIKINIISWKTRRHYNNVL